MMRRTKLSSFPSRSRAPGDPRRESGYALLVVMMMATLLLISLTAALPSVYQEGQREREEELIFRGNEYARAIALFNRQFHRYPNSVKELLQTNRMRFLRREYKDPMSRKGRWRFIHAGPNGVVLDSKTLPRPSGQSPMGSKPSTAPTTATEGKEEESAFFVKANQPVGALIVGVASSSHKESIRVFNGRTRYDEWEFLGVAASSSLGPQVPGQQGRPMPGRPPGPSNPFGPQGPAIPNLPPLSEGPVPNQ